MSRQWLQRLREERGLGVRVTTSTEVLASVRYIAEDPSALAAQAGVGLDRYSLARSIASESYGSRQLRQELTGSETGALPGDAAAHLAMAQSMLNVARRRGQSVTYVTTRSTYDVARGKYGEQHGRRWASIRDPSEWHVSAARAATESVEDLARGATSFLDPHVFLTSGMQSGRPLKPLPEKLAQWRDDGLAWIGEVPTVDPLYLVFFRRESSSTERYESMERCLQEIMSSYRGERGPWPDDAPRRKKELLAVLVATALGATSI